MPELLEVVQPGVYPWWILWFAVIPFLAGIVLAIIEEEGVWFGAGTGLAAIAFFLMAVIGITVQGDHDDAAHSDALSQAGFQEVDYDGYDGFDAVWDGERVKGVLVWNDKVGDTITYQIVIIPPVTK